MKYDLVVIGAGIQGAGVAQAAAAAGYSVLVLEQTAPAAGTSSKSSKLIHGGLRYLESAQFGLVRESLRERELLLKLAPDLVKLQPLHIPIYEHSVRSVFTIRAGLSLYSLLAGLNHHSRFRQLPRREWDQLKGLRQDGLKAVFRYYEAQTDDAALTRAVLQSAVTLGAELQMPARFIAAHRNGQRCRVEYEDARGSHAVSCRVLVNCAGPWVSQVLAGVDPALSAPGVELVQGSHLLLPPLLDQYFYLEAPADKRAVFVLPWEGKLLVGTTEKIHQDIPEKSHCSQEEQDYLLATLRHYFPHLHIDPQQVESFAGLRVLPRSDQQAFSRPREVMFEVDDPLRPRVLSIMGGKLTTYRATAQMALARIKPSLPAKDKRADTAHLPLIPVH
ncbi:glycerol-3-phosphate dehydrogenase/oxidase [Cellvibrio japonicus]|uniref:NAD binding site:D-amino acid oxidase n=1 Tax=Cellvibrio japonicus (strain Ueda107) TaxID=498211 RepID=B3PKF3_CELJU|nr:FAD-dependent oxidoreductase [Cellvibrio japonicus]ACE85767.1 NAD binding site:D-amino acid oxidase [Cellvibrio japonicus Ueda107]QEI12822.1 FAD-dependent oxidoreductase [Cellvibrio japonicus]QEI16396.1 FAD-dependent oxidoreductase [Cellvibrio japonicus]QEI19974.1 FAD-dependent oxidoreductase [Cellvibrio japonicus]